LPLHQCDILKSNHKVTDDNKIKVIRIINKTVILAPSKNYTAYSLTLSGLAFLLTVGYLSQNIILTPAHHIVIVIQSPII
jgi:hypothetical protein